MMRNSDPLAAGLGLLLTALLLMLLEAPLAAQTSPASDSNVAAQAATTLFQSGQGGYHAYRIPSLLVTAQGNLLAFCEGRKSSSRDDGDIDLVARRSSDGGATWSEARIVHEEGGDLPITIGNPCPVVDRHTGRIWLPLCRDNDRVLMTFSDDDGLSWAEPEDITAQVKKDHWGWYATGPGVGIQMQQGPHRGRLVIPCDHRERVAGVDVKHSHVFFSDDQGRTWRLGASVERHTDECQVIELEDGRLMINMRNYWGTEGRQADRGKRRAVAFSADGGSSWGRLQFDATLVEPICQASLIAWPSFGDDSRTLVLFSNPASDSRRHRLTVRLSEDQGATWSHARVLHEGPAAYSCLAILPDQHVACLYEAGQESPYQSIRLVKFPLPWLRR